MKGLALILLLLLLVSGCAAIKPEEPAFRSGTYTVRQHETLYSIAWRYGLEWQELARWNGIREPYTIYPGQRLRMNPPPGQSRTASASAPTPATTPAPRTTAATPRETRTEPPPRAATPTPTASASAPPATRPAPTASAPPPTSSSPAPTPRPSSPASSTPPRPAPVAQPVREPTTPTATPAQAATGPLVWQWPTEGQVIRRFDAQGTGKKGIAIAGQRGQPVRAAAPGRVVYSGSGLVGYGKLIIIKHNDSYLSAYGHNEKILVNEGAMVSAGQQIALLGDTGTDRPMLHFEIREDGKPVDPLRYMPGR
ncbi:peptidoglycan DD-metalloendopeptidase family protein [Ectothiorhodospira shaposhnikovii]|uniref:peptidoglycan DD-metalloendopeptidase family protein n=1 Tax=Ectothiorhodospira shaposhnikovii TaxID=1054 RepID=UPI001EE92CA6|nr:peptidoglycan DD-metalloendopeptidase family protein [Ectothiorhodospira shaposhnikovii]